MIQFDLPFSTRQLTCPVQTETLCQHCAHFADMDWQNARRCCCKRTQDSEDDLSSIQYLPEKSYILDIVYCEKSNVPWVYIVQNIKPTKIKLCHVYLHALHGFEEIVRIAFQCKATYHSSAAYEYTSKAKWKHFMITAHITPTWTHIYLHNYNLKSLTLSNGCFLSRYLHE